MTWLTLTFESRSDIVVDDGSRHRRFRPRVGLTYQQDLRSLIKELTLDAVPVPTCLGATTNRGTAQVFLED